MPGGMYPFVPPSRKCRSVSRSPLPEEGSTSKPRSDPKPKRWRASVAPPLSESRRKTGQSLRQRRSVWAAKQCLHCTFGGVPQRGSATKAKTGPNTPTKPQACLMKSGEPEITKPTSARKMVDLMSDGVFHGVAPPLGFKYQCSVKGKKAPRRGKPKELIAISPLGQPPDRTTSANGATTHLISPKISMDRISPTAATQHFKLLFFI
jgi:hypothetical protein